MADKFLNLTAVQAIKTWAKGLFALDTDLDALSTRVDNIVSQGGEPNTIDTISVNGTNIQPDANKNVELAVPTKTSDLINDSQFQDGQDVADAIEHMANLYMQIKNNQLSGANFYANAYPGSGLEVSIDQNHGVDMSFKSSPLNPVTVELASKSYVDQNGGKIDKIKVNGTEQTITNKEVDITVPTAVSDLTNDSGFQTASDVSSAISTALTSAMTYKGSVATVADLPSSGNKVGDFYNVTATGENYAWDGSAWDKVGDILDTSTFWSNQSGQSNSLEAATVAEINAILNA